MNIHIRVSRTHDRQYFAYYWVDGFTPDEHMDLFYGRTEAEAIGQIVVYLVKAGYTPKIKGIYKE